MTEKRKKKKLAKDAFEAQSEHMLDSQIVWTGPSVRLKNIRDLMESKEMEDDLKAVDRLRRSGLLTN